MRNRNPGWVGRLLGKDFSQFRRGFYRQSFSLIGEMLRFYRSLGRSVALSRKAQGQRQRQRLSTHAVELKDEEGCGPTRARSCYGCGGGLGRGFGVGMG